MKRVLFFLILAIIGITLLLLLINLIFFSSFTERGIFSKKTVYGKSQVIKLYSNHAESFETIAIFMDEKAIEREVQAIFINKLENADYEILIQTNVNNEKSRITVDDLGVDKAIREVLSSCHIASISLRKTNNYQYIDFLTDKSLYGFSNGIIKCKTNMELEDEYITYLSAIDNSFYYYEAE